MRRVPAFAFVALFATGAAACGSSSGGDADPQPTTPAASEASGAATTATTAMGATPASGVTLKVADNATLGDIVTDQDGRTLYLFTADSGTTTACTGGCASLWPALVAPATAGDGVTGTVTDARQADGTDQVALGGHLLYYYGGDTSPGATSGQGVGGNWFVVSPSGDAIEQAPASGGY